VGFLVGIDQGTSGTTVLVFDQEFEERNRATQPVSSNHTPDGGVEQDPWVVLASVVEACALAMAGITEEVETTGFAHQGETVLAWDADTLEPLTPAIVWSDRRPEAVTRRLREEGRAQRVFELSGMPLDSYFCAAKYRWLVDEYPELASSRAFRLGTLESWLLLQLGATEQTDIGTASRTQLTRLGGAIWDPNLLDIFGLSSEWLVPIGPTVTDRGQLSHADWDFQLPLRAVLVDQPAALFGNGYVRRGDMKVTYGTGAFVMANAGWARPQSQTSVITSVGWDIGDGPVYVMDGGVLSVGSALAWLESLGVDVSPVAHQRLVGRGPSSLVVAPALNGTGAPHWNRTATASISGVTAATTGDDLLQAFLDSFAYRVREIVDAMVKAGVPSPTLLRVDGGLTRSAYLMSCQASVLGVPVAVADNDEATAVGASLMAGRSSPNAAPSLRVIEPAHIEMANAAYERWRNQVAP